MGYQKMSVRVYKGNEKIDIQRIILTDSVFTENSLLPEGRKIDLKLLFFFNNSRPIYYFAVVKKSSEEFAFNFIRTHILNLPVLIFSNNSDFFKFTVNFPFAISKSPNYIPEKGDFILLFKDNEWYEIFILDEGGENYGNERL
jgi:hypothetical protein